MNFYYVIKRIFDFLISVIVLFVLSPLFLIIGILIKLNSSGPIFFVQERIGKNGKIFKMYKFRTMVDGAYLTGKLVTDVNDSRITKVGKFLRKYKLDEIPQFINVFIGNMSIVGPRPEVLKYIHYYSKKEKDIILSVKPGVMGLATLDFMDEEKIINKGKNCETLYVKEVLPKKLKLDLEYISKKSFWLDCKIFLKNVVRIFNRRENYEY